LNTTPRARARVEPPPRELHIHCNKPAWAHVRANAEVELLSIVNLCSRRSEPTRAFAWASPVRARTAATARGDAGGGAALDSHRGRQHPEMTRLCPSQDAFCTTKPLLLHEVCVHRLLALLIRQPLSTLAGLGWHRRTLYWPKTVKMILLKGKEIKSLWQNGIIPLKGSPFYRWLLVLEK
jgi:hypothetical protein